MMKLRTIAIAALAAMIFASCSKDNNGPDPDPGYVPGEETYATFKVSVTDATSRAFHGQLAPTAEERAVDQLTVYIYDEYTAEIEKVLTFADENDTQSVLIILGPKKIFATSSITPVYAVGDPFDLTKEIDVISEAYFTGTVTLDNKFWMTSDIVEKTLILATQQDAETANHNNNITLRLGRAMVKIGVAYDPANVSLILSEAAEGDFTDFEYKVKNNPNKMYLFTGVDVNNILITPYYQRNGNLWAPSHAADYWHQPDYHSALLTASNHNDPTYMMENSNMIARHGNATYVSIRGKFEPTDLCDASGNSGEAPTSDGTFWRVAEVEFEADGTTIKRIINFDPNYYAVSNPIIQAASSYNAVIEYTEGWVYWYLYLDCSLGNADKYSQYRNQYWDVSIDKINGWGSNEEDGGRPEDPESLEGETWITASVQVLNWVGIKMEGKLPPMQQ